MSRSSVPAFCVAILAMVFAFALGCGDKTKKPGSCKGDKDCKNSQVCDNNKCVECVHRGAGMHQGRSVSDGPGLPGGQVQAVRDQRGLRAGRHVRCGGV